MTSASSITAETVVSALQTLCATDIENWKIVPDGLTTVCVVGIINGEERRTAPLTAQSREGGYKWVKTCTGSIYKLMEMNSKPWRLELKTERPLIYEKFLEVGFFD